VGGDLCELIPLDEHRTVIVVGDASGDSIPAALIMAGVRGALHALPCVPDSHGFPTDRLVARLNDVLCRITPSHQFMSLLYGVWDTERRTLTYTNAGHPSPILIRNGELSFLESQGLLLGVVPESTYGRRELRVDPGDVLVGYTDGITEAVDHRREMFRVEGIIRAVSQMHDAPAAEILAEVWQRLEAHTAGSNCGDDDRTLLVVRACATA
jgi:sigma-B regulation protein RsbU (phosphoserine phosphatase)